MKLFIKLGTNQGGLYHNQIVIIAFNQVTAAN